MRLTYILEINHATHQYKMTIVPSGPPIIELTRYLNERDTVAFPSVSTHPTPESLLALLEPMLRLEESSR